MNNPLKNATILASRLTSGSVESLFDGEADPCVTFPNVHPALVLDLGKPTVMHSFQLYFGATCERAAVRILASNDRNMNYCPTLAHIKPQEAGWLTADSTQPFTKYRYLSLNPHGVVSLGEFRIIEHINLEVCVTQVFADRPFDNTEIQTFGAKRRVQLYGKHLDCVRSIRAGDDEITNFTAQSSNSLSFCIDRECRSERLMLMTETQSVIVPQQS